MKLRSDTHEVADALDAIEYCFEQGWTDGLPVVPPTEEKIREFLEYARLEPQQVIGTVPERGREITAEKAAINAVMAGCRKEYMPVVVAAVEAVCDPMFQFNHLASMGSPWPLMIISGPIVKSIGINCGMWVLGPGTRANSTIGRALSLIVSNCAEGRSGSLQRGTYGHPGRYGSMCVGENPEEFGWVPHRVELGFSRHESTVTMVSTYPWIEMPHCPVMEPEAILGMISLHIAEAGFYRGVYPILMGRPWAEVFVRAGWTKQRMIEWMEENTFQTVAQLKQRKRWGLFASENGSDNAHSFPVEPGDDVRRIYIWKDGDHDKYVFHEGSRERKRGMYFIVAGGDAGNRTCFMCPYMISTNPVTKAVMTVV